MAVFATARMTALSPGQSPPPVSTPIRLIVGMEGMGTSKRQKVKTAQSEYRLHHGYWFRQRRRLNLRARGKGSPHMKLVSNGDRPRILVGIPVYNEQRYVTKV